MTKTFQKKTDKQDQAVWTLPTQILWGGGEPSRIQDFCDQGFVFSGESMQDECIYSLLCRWHHQAPLCAIAQTARTQTHLEFSILRSLPLSELSFHLCIILRMKGISGALTVWIHQHQTECKEITWIMHTWKKTTKKKRLYKSLWSRDRGRILKSLPKFCWS